MYLQWSTFVFFESFKKCAGGETALESDSCRRARCYCRAWWSRLPVAVGGPPNPNPNPATVGPFMSQRQLVGDFEPHPRLIVLVMLTVLPAFWEEQHNARLLNQTLKWRASL